MMIMLMVFHVMVVGVRLAILRVGTALMDKIELIVRIVTGFLLKTVLWRRLPADFQQILIHFQKILYYWIRGAA